MAVLGIDLGGTKLTLASFAESGKIIRKQTVGLDSRKGLEVGELIKDQIKKNLQEFPTIRSLGIAVPGISYRETGTVWAPNIPGWENYPLLEEAKQVSRGLSVTIDSDRACYMLGEQWQGNAKGSRDAVFLAIGTGIGAGILVNGAILRGAHDIAGALGWMALNKPFQQKYISCGNFEYHASGEGIAKVTRELLLERSGYKGELNRLAADEITSRDVFAAYEKNDPLAIEVLGQCIGFWGMAVANLVSILNPEKIIIGGGVFGPGIQFIDAIKKEAFQWAQPISMKQVELVPSGLGSDAGVYGAGFLALDNFTA